MREVDRQPQPGGDRFVPRELPAVVERLRPTLRRRQPTHGCVQRLLRRLRRGRLQLPRHRVLAGTIHVRQYVAATALAHERVAFPVAQTLAVVDGGRPLVDADAIGDLAAFGGLSVGFSTLPPGHAKVRPQALRTLRTRPDPAVDRAVGDRLAFQPFRRRPLQPTRDLLGRPLGLELALHVRHQLGVVGARPAAGPPATLLGLALGMVIEIPPPPAGVALQLATDRAAMATDRAADLRRRPAGHSHVIDEIPFLPCKMLVGHRAGSFRFRSFTNLNLTEPTRGVPFFEQPATASSPCCASDVNPPRIMSLRVMARRWISRSMA